MPDETSQLWSPTGDGTPRRADVLESYTVRWAHADPVDGRVLWVDFAIYEKRLMDDAACYERPGARTPADWTSNLDEAAPLVTGFVKWDGCTQWRQEHHAHIDGRKDLDGYVAALQLARMVALTEMLAALDDEYVDTEGPCPTCGVCSECGGPWDAGRTGACTACGRR